MNANNGVQRTLEGENILDVRIKESFAVIKRAVKKTGDTPLIVNFSGGKDSMVLLDLVRRTTDKYVCCYMISGIEFPEAIDFVKTLCERLDVRLLLSSPADYKGGFFSRLPIIGYFPTVQNNTLWCNRDLKIRPQKVVLKRVFGNQLFFKLNGVRRYESSRRMKMHRKTRDFMREDYHVSKSLMVFPILNWTDDDVKKYLKLRAIHVAVNPLYERYGVSGCYWCPFYQKQIYERILSLNPNLYDEFIEWETKLNKPCASGHTWLRDLKRQSLHP